MARDVRSRDKEVPVFYFVGGSVEMDGREKVGMDSDVS